MRYFSWQHYQIFQQIWYLFLNDKIWKPDMNYVFVIHIKICLEFSKDLVIKDFFWEQENDWLLHNGWKIFRLEKIYFFLFKTITEFLSCLILTIKLNHPVCSHGFISTKKISIRHFKIFQWIVLSNHLVLYKKKMHEVLKSEIAIFEIWNYLLYLSILFFF